MAVVVWPSFVFGGVYPTIYAVTTALSVLFALLAVRAGGWRVESGLTVAALAVLVAVGVQLIPLPDAVLSRVSPPTVAFLESHNVGYALATLAGERPAHPLSIDPAATWRFILFFLTVCLVFAGVRSLGAIRSLRVLVTTVTVVGAGLACVGLAQAGIGTDRMYGIWAPQTAAAVFGPFVNRNHFAAFTLMALPMAMTQCAAYARQMRRQSGSTRFVELIGTPAASHALLSGFAAVVMSLALVMTRSRSGLAGFVVVLAGVCAIVAARPQRPRARIVAGLLVVTLGVGVTAWFGWDRLMARFVELPGSRLSGRVDAWSEGLRIAGAFWPMGSGLNTYSSAMLAHHDPAVELYFRTPHNDYLQVLTDGGLLVGLPLAALIGLLAVRLIAAVRSSASSSSFDAWTRSGALAGLAAVALQEFVDFSLQTQANAVLFAVLAGYVLSQPPPRTRLASALSSVSLKPSAAGRGFMVSQTRDRSSRLVIHHRLRVLEAVFALAIARIALRVLPFSWIAGLVGATDVGRDLDGPRPPARDSVAAGVRAALRGGARRLPWRSTCLTRALAGRMMLARRGVPSALVLGVTRDGTRFAAHAWLMTADGTVCGGREASRFRPLAAIRS